MLKKLSVYLRTARYYRKAQIAARLKLNVQAKLAARFPGLAHRRYYEIGDIALNPDFRCFEGVVEGQPSTEALKERARQIRLGKFTFLNLEKDLGSPIDWDPQDSTRLWRYNLHYFDYALELARVARADKQDLWATETLRWIFRDWIEANSVGHGVGWHSYPSARRIVNWIHAYSLVGPASLFSVGTEAEAWRSSLFQQVLYLENHLEFDCLGNHLLTNGKALLYAGLFFTGNEADRWIRRGEEILLRSLDEQVLADGGHEERSPMYQMIVLQDSLEALVLLKLNEKIVPAQIPRALVAMGDFLEGMLHPDGQIALFGDAAFSIAHDPNDVLAAVAWVLGLTRRWRSAKPGLYCALMAPQPATEEMRLQSSDAHKIRSWPNTGYFKLTGANPEEDQMIVDGHPMGPPHLPAHGHCSLFSYELSLQGQRMIVDSGVEEYEAGPWRDFWRSTRAHNTLTVDGAEQTEVWASFRAARRTEMQECAFVENDFGAMFVGRHSGFATQISRTPHRRIIVSLREGIWLVLDQVFGQGRRRVESYIHLHPQVCSGISGEHVELSRPGERIRIYPMENPVAPVSISSVKGTTNPIQGWYAPEFGRREPNEVLCLSFEAPLPAQSGYLIVPTKLGVHSWNIELDEVQDRVVGAAVSIKTGFTKIERQFRISQN